MTSLAGSLADGVLADAILVPPHPPIPPTNLRKYGVFENGTETSNKNDLLVNKQRRCMDG